jgi:hypothetical protein
MYPKKAEEWLMALALIAIGCAMLFFSSLV